MATKGDLVKHQEAGGFLFCHECGNEASGNPSDYFGCPAEHKFYCTNDHPALEMDLVYKQVTYASLINGKEFLV
jgi:hypothetical protein